MVVGISLKREPLKFVHDKYMSNQRNGKHIILIIVQFITNIMENKTLFMILALKIIRKFIECGQWIAKYDKDFDKNLRYNKMYMEAFNEDYMILGEGLNDNIKIVHFANVWNNIHDNNESWVRENWK